MPYDFIRPRLTQGGALITIPAAMLAHSFLGNTTLTPGGCCLTQTELERLRKLYKFEQLSQGDYGANALLRAGDTVNILRHAEADGMRLVAWISKLCEGSEDPLKVLVRMAVEAGFDVDAQDVDWANGWEGPPSEDEDAESEGVEDDWEDSWPDEDDS